MNLRFDYIFTNFSHARAVVALFAAVWVCCAIASTGPALAEAQHPDPPSIPWSYRALSKPLPPAIDSDWPRNAIDHFILARLREHKLSPTPPADRRTLIRRLSFDLIGLPPTPAEVDAFVNDDRPGAYERLVERLLSSPHYGERWARHWLDVARFSESQGFERDKMRRNGWHYRDYVIAAFNDDKPYDRFVMEQIAGDVMQPITAEGIIATSLLVCGSFDEVGANQQSKIGRASVREEELEDMIGVVTQTFLGATVNCARCHDHKYDPISQVDYTRIKAVFEGVRHGERQAASAEQVEARKRRVAELNAAIEDSRRELAAIDAEARRRALAQRRDADEVADVTGPAPWARWTFDDGSTRDVAGSLDGELHGGAAIEDGLLIVDGKGAFMRTGPIGRDIREKTLEAWLVLPTRKQGGGGAITIESSNGREFDSIVFGERQPNKWIAGSNSFVRTLDLDAPQENAGPGEIIHIAIVYAADNSVAVYRNGQPYAPAYKKDSLKTYRAGDARVVLGMRHTGGGNAFLNARIDSASLYDRALSADEVAASFRASGRFVSDEEALAAMTPAQRASRNALRERIEAVQRQVNELPAFPVVYSGVRRQPESTRLLNRGDATQPGEVVSPGALSELPGFPGFELPADAPEAQRRLRLAQWLADPRNPLTARVMVNRVWHHHFGRGIVATPNDFGQLGAEPTHPDLLDWLAATFIESGWSVKDLHRLIVTSATYRQGGGKGQGPGKGRGTRAEGQGSGKGPLPSALGPSIDADNTLLWRFTPQRLEGEAVRDAVLAVSGRLNRAMGGPSFEPFDVEINNSHFYRLKDVSGPEYDRRTIYRANISSGKDPMLEALDCPDPSVKAPRRRVTTTPLSSLILMNGRFVQREAGHFADRVMREAGGDVERAVTLAFEYAFARPPTDEERRESAAHAREHGMEELCWVLLNASEFIYVR